VGCRELKHHSFLNSAPDGGEYKLHTSTVLPLGKTFYKRLGGFQAQLESKTMRKISAHAGNQTPVIQHKHKLYVCQSAMVKKKLMSHTFQITCM
jgi:hypothetical protein